MESRISRGRVINRELGCDPMTLKRPSSLSKNVNRCPARPDLFFRGFGTLTLGRSTRQDRGALLNHGIVESE